MMTEEQQRKLDKAKEKLANQSIEVTHEYIIDKSFREEFQKELSELSQVVSENSNLFKEKLSDFVKTLEAIGDSIDIKDKLGELQASITGINIPDNKEVSVKDLKKLIKSVEDNKPLPYKEIKFDSVLASLKDVRQAIEKRVAFSQAPQDFMPVRRVFKIGNTWYFDDNPSTGGGGSGGSPSPTGQSSDPIYITGSVTTDEASDRDNLGNQATTITSSTSETTIITADATYKLDLYGLVLTNTSATATKVTIKDSTEGTTRFVFQVPATDTRGFMLPVDSAHKQAAANNNWTVTCGTSVADLVVTALFVKNT